MNELKSCPFCGCLPTMSQIGNLHTKSVKIEIKCIECRVKRVNAILSGRTQTLQWLKDKSIEQWNMRHE